MTMKIPVHTLIGMVEVMASLPYLSYMEARGQLPIFICLEWKMKSIRVIRKRSFRSALMPYWIVVSNISKNKFLQSHGFTGDLCDHDQFGQTVSRIEVSELDQIGIRIKNGQIIEVPVQEDAVSVFVITFGGSISNELLIDEINDTLTITTKGGFKTVSYPHIET